MVIERSIAYKVWISDIINSNYIKQEGFNPNYIELNGNNVSRVNLIATIVAKFMSEDGNYGALTIDDGTDTIRLKAFGPEVEKIKSAEIGMLMRVVGKVKDRNDERYLLADFVKEIKDPNWLIVHKLEAGKPSEIKETTDIPNTNSTNTKENSPIESKSGEDKSKQSSAISSDKSKETLAVSKDKPEDIPNFVEIISKLDSGDGAEIDTIIKESKLSEEEAKSFIVNLLKDGEIYEPRKGKLKVL
jgi:RPA family protein